MCMPILLAIIVAMVWLGFSVVGQSEVTVEARHQAWKRRFDGEQGTVLDFLSDDFATEEANKQVQISPLVDDLTPPASSHDVAVGTWDYTNLEMNAPPSWEHYLVAAANAKTGGLQVAYSDARNELQQLQGSAETAMYQAIQNTIAEFLEDPLTNLTNAAEIFKRESTNKVEQEKAALDAEIRSISDEILAVERSIRDLTRRKGEAKDAEEEESIDFRIAVNRNKIKRLQADRESLRTAAQ